MKRCGAEAFTGICQYRKTDHLHSVAIPQAILIGKHPLGKFNFGLTLHFNVNQHPGLATVFRIDLDQFIGVTSAAFGTNRNLLQFLIKETVAF